MDERTQDELPSDPGAVDAFIQRTYGRSGGGDDLAVHPPAAPHLLIRASAGTGKTYRLTTRYLRLLRAGETAEHILATTFTRKAAGEVLGRVLGWLARASVDARERAGLDDALGGFGLSEAECLAMLRRLVDGLNRLAIGTIDSFFNRAARALRFELDLPAEPRLMDAYHPAVREIRYDAIQRVLGDAAASDDGFQTLIELLRRVHHDTAERSVTEAIDALVVELHDVYRQYDERALWSTLDPPAVLSRDLLVAVVQDVIALGEHIPLTKTGTPRKTWATAYETISAAAQRHDFDAILQHPIGQRLLEDGDGAVYGGCAVPEVWRGALVPVLQHARAQTLQQLAHMTESTYDLLHAFSSQYESAKRSARVLLFSDLTHLLARAMPGLGEDVAEQFYYRLDSRVTHLLLDEFQDTSLPQWQVLEPFALEVTAAADGARSFFCVGDEKQAIYGWRGGCAELFSAVEALPGVVPWTMTQSRRSSAVVLDAVNQVFSTLTTNAALDDKHHRWDNAVGAWAGRYEMHAAHDTSLPGHVLLKTTSPSDQETTRDDGGEDDEAGVASPHEVYCAEHIAALAEASPGKTIGVLLRRKKAARGLLHRLRGLGVAVSEEGGNPIDHTPAVSAVLSAIQLADHPGDTVAAFHVGNSPLGAVIGVDWRDPGAVASAALGVRRALLDRGFGETVAQWCKAVASSCDARALHRLEQLVGLAQQYDQDMAGAVPGGGALRVSGFVEVVRRARVESPTPASVRVMTLHAAKGLEFDTVVLPDLHAVLSQSDRNALVMLDRDSPLDRPRAVVRRVKRDKLSAIGLEHLADREDAWQRGEDLCLLYVGMTRAKHALHLLVPPLKETKSGLSSVGRTNLSFAAILRQALASDVDESAAGDEVLYEIGDPDWASGGAPVADATAGPSAPGVAEVARGVITLAPSGPPTRGMPERRPSDGAEDTRVLAADLLKLSPSGGRGFGSAMHAVCELLGFAGEDALPDADAVVSALGRAGQPSGSGEVEAFGQRLSALLSHDAVRSCLSRAGACELWRERGFAVVLDGRLLRGVFDRVHVWRDEDGMATRARLIDFKTDRIPDAGPSALASLYAGQVNAYRAALCAMLSIRPEAVEAMLLLTGDGVVVPVSPGAA
ncbi:MAG: UvrD-helicase domain-containing protein [Phycisphaerales bacterium JB063]